MFMRFRQGLTTFTHPIWSQHAYRLPEHQPFSQGGLTAENVAPTPQGVYRKRPVKLFYDANEFHMFRLPSENQFLLSNFNKTEIFGERKGITHSPHIKAQVDLDTNLCVGFLMFSLALLTWETKRTFRYITIKSNVRHGDMGKFELDDFN